MKIGDFVKYRSWRPGDPEKSSVPSGQHGWDQTGVIVEISDWNHHGVLIPNECATILNHRGDFVDVWKNDIEILN